MHADNIKRNRAKVGLPRDQLARKAGITYSTLAKLESGVNQNPKVKTLQQLAKARTLRRCGPFGTLSSL